MSIISDSGSGNMVYGAVAMRNKNHIPGTDYTEQFELLHGEGGGVAGLAIVDREVLTPSVVDIDGNLSRAVDWAVIGVEIINNTSLAKNKNEEQDFIDSPKIHIPTEFELHQNYPNPFNPSTSITFVVPQTMDVQLIVFDTRGALIAKLVDDVVEAGKHTYIWRSLDYQGNILPNGIYFYRIKTNRFVETKKMILAK